jgi:hypothetical protein
MNLEARHLGAAYVLVKTGGTGDRLDKELLGTTHGRIRRPNATPEDLRPTSERALAIEWPGANTIRDPSSCKQRWHS